MRECVFCDIVQGVAPASIVCEDTMTMAFVDLRQFHAGHVLVVPREHAHDVRDLDAPTGAAFMAMLSRVTRAVALAFPNDGLSVWHSVGDAGGQEVPHMHFHVHPRLSNDNLLRIYPHAPRIAERDVRDAYAARLRDVLE